MTKPLPVFTSRTELLKTDPVNSAYCVEVVYMMETKSMLPIQDKYGVTRSKNELEFTTDQYIAVSIQI